MPLYSVDVVIEMTMVVQADDEDHAWDVAYSEWREMLNDDCPEPDISVLREVAALSELPKDWDELCVPYGGNRNARVGEILPTPTTPTGDS